MCAGVLTQLESWNYWTQRDIPWSIGLDHLTQSHDTLAWLTRSDWFLLFPIIILLTSSLIITGHADRPGQVTWPSCCRVDNAEARLGLFDSVNLTPLLCMNDADQTQTEWSLTTWPCSLTQNILYKQDVAGCSNFLLPNWTLPGRFLFCLCSPWSVIRI